MSTSGSKKGGNFFGNIGESFSEPFTRKGGNFFENMFEGVVNGYTQIFTGGMVGYKDGKMTAGFTGAPTVNGLKTVTGAKAAEDANAFARENFEKAEADAIKARQEQQAQVGRDQLQQSMMAASARGGSSTGNANRGTKTDVLGAERDFLGL